MRMTLLAGAALAALAAGAKTSTPAGWTDDYDAALRKAASERKLVVADFSGSDWCGWCKRLDREVFATEEFRQAATNRFVLLIIDTPMDKSLLSAKAKRQNPALVKKYAIRGFPTVLMLDKDGKVVHQAGYQAGGPSPYLKMLEDAARKAANP